MARRWPRHEDDFLRDRYAGGTPLAEIARRLGRTEDAVEARRRALGLPARRWVRPWSRREDAILRASAEAGLPAAAVGARLGRPPGQVLKRRRELGLGRDRARAYTPAEDALIRSEWSAGAALESVARRLGRAPEAVRLRARKLGLHRPAARPRWTAEEDAVVREGYTSGLPCGEIASLLARRTPTAVAARAQKLGLATYARRWTRDDDAHLARILAVASPRQAAEILGRTPEAVRRRARRQAIAAAAVPSAPRSGRRWTREEDERLRMHASLNPAVLGALLGRSDHAVAARLRQLGGSDGRRRSPHHPSATRGGLTPGERALLQRELSARGERALQVLARRLERSITELRAAADW